MKQGWKGGLGCARTLCRDGARHVGRCYGVNLNEVALKIPCKQRRYEGKDRSNNFDEMAIKSESNEGKSKSTC